LPAGTYTVELSLIDRATKAQASTNTLTFAAPAPSTPLQTTTRFALLSVTPGPDADKLQFATISGKSVNGGQPVSNARLTVHAQKDGKDVESFQLIPSLSLVQGETAIEQRYIPGTGFTTGTWSFSLTLESIDPATGAASLLLEQEIGKTIVVP